MLNRLMAGLVATTVPLAVYVAEPEKPVTAFVNVSVIPMDRDQVLADQTVLVQGDRIVKIGPVSQIPVPAKAVRVDGRGKFLIPGLADMHTHVHVHTPRSPALDSVMLEQMLFLYVANGVTTIRNMQDIYLPLRERAANGKLLSPRIYTSGHKLHDTARVSSANDSIVAIPTPEAAAEVVAKEKAAGYDFLKIYWVHRGVFDSIVAVAHRLGFRFAGHAPADVPIERALEAGYSSIEHLSGYVQWGHQPSYPNSSRIAELAAATKRAGVWNCPTFVVQENQLLALDPEGLEQRPEMRYISDFRLKTWRSADKYDPQTTTVLRYLWTDELRLRRKLTKALHDSGAGLLLGTDAPDRYAIPGFAIHRELEAMVEAGLTPYQALETGTRNVAVFFGTLDSTGTVAVGKRADLVLLDGNPLVDIRQTARPTGVMIGGRWLPRKEIDARLATMEKAIS